MQQKIILALVALVLIGGGVALGYRKTTGSVKNTASTAVSSEGSAADKSKDEAMVDKTAKDQPQSEAMMAKDKADSAMKKTGEAMAKSSYAGEVLAGSSSKYLSFVKADYDAALKSDNVILLDFFANWCPICRAETPELKAGFDALTTDKVVGFRVNYNDSDTDADEKALATQFHIPYQHTKVILKGGKEVGRSSDQWDKGTVLSELKKYY